MDEMDSEPSAREGEQSWEKAEDDVNDMGFVDQNMVDDLDYNSNALESVHSEDDERGKKHEHFQEFNEKTDMKNLTLTLDLVFRDHVQFKQVVIMYSLVNGYGEIHFPRNEKLKISVQKAALGNVVLERCMDQTTYKSRPYLITTLVGGLG